MILTDPTLMAMWFAGSQQAHLVVTAGHPDHRDLFPRGAGDWLLSAEFRRHQ